MPYSPLVSKIRVHNPNKKSSSIANRNHLLYIAAREGVSLEKVHQEADNEQYLHYMAKRPRSHGLFGNIDTEDLKEVSSQVARLTDSGRIIYRGIISLGEQDADELGFRNINAWNNYLKQVMPEIAQNLGISSVDHTWVAAFHAEEKHPHVHYMLWDNKDKIKSPYIHKATQQKIRICLEEKMFDNEYERMIAQVQKEELDMLKSLRSEERSYILKNTEDIIESIGYVPGALCERLPQRVPNVYLEELAEEVEKLFSVLPDKGRLAYKFLPEEAKQQLDIITNKLLERPDMQSTYDKYMQNVEQMQKLRGRTKTKIKSEMEKAQGDIRKRIANRVLEEVKKKYIFENQKAKEISQVENEPEERNSVPFKDQEEQNPVPFMLEMEEYGNENLRFIQVEKDVAVISNNYFMEWNDAYKAAIDDIYNKGDIQNAFQELERQAKLGNVLAISELGKMIERELTDVPVEGAGTYYKEALEAFEGIYDKEEENEYIREYAAYRSGKLYEFGKGGIEIDYDKAKAWYTKATGNKFAQYSLAKLYLSEKVYVGSEKNLIQNQEKAFELLKSSAQLNNPFAAYELGNMYANGIYTECDFNQADMCFGNALNKFLEMADKSTDDSLFYRIGMMYLKGLGTEASADEAERYIRKAGELGNENAKLALSSMYLEKDEAVFQEQALLMLKELSDKNNDRAQYKLGCIYSDEEKLENYDLSKAIEYLEKAAVQGNQYAQCKLGVIYYFGKGIQKDVELGKHWLEASAEQGNEFAKVVLEGSTVDFAYCLLKGVLSSMETFNRQQAYEQLIVRTQSRQAMKEEYLHSDIKKSHEM